MSFNPVSEAMRLMQADIARTRHLRPQWYDIPVDPVDFIQTLNINTTDKYTVDGRPWLPSILRDESREIVILKARQVGYSLMTAGLLVYHAMKEPGTNIIYASMRFEQVRFQSQERIRPMLAGLPDVTIDQGVDRIKSIKLGNGSLITFVSGSNGFSQARGYPADVLFLDECEAMPMHERDVIMECLHASPHPRTYAGGSGGIEGSPWEAYWLQSDQCEWDADRQDWIPDNPDAAVRGYHIGQRLSPYWTQEADDRKKATYDSMRYATEVLGTFSRAGQIPITLEMVRDCQSPDNFTEGKIYAGIDLGTGKALSVIVIVRLDDKGVMHVVDIQHTNAPYAADILPVISEVLQRWQPAAAAADAGGASKELHRDLCQEYDTLQNYRMSAPKEPVKYGNRDDDEIIINRTFFVQRIIDRFHKGTITLPRHLDSWMLDHLTAERAETRHNKDKGDYITYTKQENRSDDLLMSLVFAEAAAYAGADNDNPKNRVYHSKSFGVLGSGNGDWARRHGPESIHYRHPRNDSNYVMSFDGTSGHYE